MVKKQNAYNGDDRRTGIERRTCPNHDSCLNHTGLIERIKSNEQKTTAMENKNFVPFNNYKWGIGILSSVLLSLFSISIYLALNTSAALSTISAKQETTIYKITVVQKDIEDLKRSSTDELKEIKRKIHQHIKP